MVDSLPSYNVVIIGCGNIAGGFDSNIKPSDWPLTHAGAYVSNKKFHIVACCDPDIEKRTKFQSDWKVPLSTSSPNELEFGEGEVDVVSICSPTAFHAESIRSVLRWKPRLIFCEKPIASNLHDARSLTAICRDAGVELVVNYSRRWDPDVCRLKSDIAAGKWGAVHSITGLYNKGVLNNGGHLIDLVQFLFGSLTVLASGRGGADYWEHDPSIACLLETEDGVPVTLNIGDAKNYSLFELEIIFEGGVVRMESGGLKWVTKQVVESADFTGYKVLGPASSYEGRYKECMSRAVANIYNYLVGEAEFPSTATTALKAQAVCQEILERSTKK
jgi:predicted dehydrogenase